MPQNNQYIMWFDQLGSEHVGMVGGKNASLGEMIQNLKDKGTQVPEGFATTSGAYETFMEENSIRDEMDRLIREFRDGAKTLEKVGKSIRALFTKSRIPEEVADAIRDAYQELSMKYDEQELDVAVRSSATAEDLPEASFAGQQETYLNISGPENLLEAVRNCYASLFTDRAISYREEKGFEHNQIALSVGVQKMVRSDRASAGVMFSIDTETGFKDMVVINAAWGLGENVVQGAITPDEYRVFKPILGKNNFKPIVEKTLGAKEKMMIYAGGGKQTIKNVDTPKEQARKYTLNDEEILQLAAWAVDIESHYGKPMDMEWAKDGMSGEIFIVQARPETVQSQKETTSLKAYTLKEEKEPLIKGISIGDSIATGKAQKILSSDDKDKFRERAILVTEMTDPDWVPIMKKAAGIITDRGGRTCHAAIVSRELGIPAIVGAGSAVEKIDDGMEITLSCAQGDQGFVYSGQLKYDVEELSLKDIPETKTRIMMNIASPSGALRWRRLPAQGIGLARMEFIINNFIKIHPMALVGFDKLKDESAKETIENMTRDYKDKSRYFVDQLALGIAKIASSQYPEPVVLRMSDFKTNEYADLIGGEQFEPGESNPMLGWRGASRYYSEGYKPGFGLECEAIKKVRNEIGLDNLVVMIPFCRTPEEADKVLEVMEEFDLKRGQNGLEVYVMCEIPSNVILADQFAQRFDGFSIGSNDLTQLVLGVDRDSSQLAHIFDERSEAVKRMISSVIQKAHENHCKVGICGQAPSDYPEFAKFLIRSGIDSISLNPDSIIGVKRLAAEIESEQR